MKKINLLMLLFLFSCSALNLSEVNSDIYWERITKLALAERSVTKALEISNPKLLSQMNLDGQDQVLVDLWGQSFNFDSGAKQTILDESIIEQIQSKFSVKNDNKIVHAGIMHSYGYLFSVLSTPYGFKRKRWTDPTINYGFGLNQESIGAAPLEGTLLSNLTYFVGKIAFKESESLKKISLIKNASLEIKNYKYEQLSIVYLEEEITNPKELQLTLRTSLVKLLNKSDKEENDYLLIYSTLNRATKVEQLITAFPIKKDAYKKIIDENLLGEDRPILIRYNASIDTAKDQRFSGKRFIKNKN